MLPIQTTHSGHICNSFDFLRPWAHRLTEEELHLALQTTTAPNPATPSPFRQRWRWAFCYESWPKIPPVRETGMGESQWTMFGERSWSKACSSLNCGRWLTRRREFSNDLTEGFSAKNQSWCLQSGEARLWNILWATRSQIYHTDLSFQRLTKCQVIIWDLDNQTECSAPDGYTNGHDKHKIATTNPRGRHGHVICIRWILGEDYVIVVM